MKILAIESSCDETAAAVVEDGRHVISSVIASQVKEHILYGGVVPEIASRRHAEAISGVVGEALDRAEMKIGDVDAIAVTYAPGLIGALLVGVNFAKGLAFSANKPLVPVHHLRSHIAANYITHPDLEPPFLALVVSGGHSHIIEVRDYTDFNVIGRTRDDAAGEAFDKAARVLGLPYPGGPNIERLAREGENNIVFPNMLKGESGYEFSYSGLKTAVINYCHTKEQKGEPICRADVAASFQASAVNVLVERAVRAAKEYKVNTIAAGGGVVANGYLRERLQSACGGAGLKLILPEKRYCTDNAAMIAAEGLVQYRLRHFAPLSLNAAAHIPLGKKGKQ